VTNAIRHTPENGRVLVTATAEAGGVLMTVADSCGGIPDADLPLVFDTGWRGSAARTPSADGGAGLGLAIVRGIALAHHGQVSVVNTGAGCRFEIRLPTLVTDCDDAAGGYVGAGRSAEVPISSL
jgi:signal transduction histidine kinase